eukprot:scaffold668786_cov85-Prasinocladus_malaysianus.AAC.1
MATITGKTMIIMMMTMMPVSKRIQRGHASEWQRSGAQIPCIYPRHVCGPRPPAPAAARPSPSHCQKWTDTWHAPDAGTGRPLSPERYGKARH